VIEDIRIIVVRQTSSIEVRMFASYKRIIISKKI